jgi:hypothetical protein
MEGFGMTLIEAAKQALEALDAYSWEQVNAARAALRTAIEQAEKQEPVAWRWVPSKVWHDYVMSDDPERAKLAREHGIEVQPLYTTPPAAQRQPLTDEAIWRQYQALWPFHPAEEPRLAKDIVKFARAVEAAHGIKEKNT